MSGPKKKKKEDPAPAAVPQTPVQPAPAVPKESTEPPQGDDNAMGDTANVGPDDEAGPQTPLAGAAVALPEAEPATHPLSDEPRGSSFVDYKAIADQARRQSMGHGYTADREVLAQCAGAIYDLLGIKESVEA